MVKSNRMAAAAVLLALAPGCAGTSPMVPAGSQTTSAVLASVPPSGRVVYVADLDGQPGVGRIHVYQATMNNPKWIRDITQGAGRPFGMWVDDRNDLYVANQTDKFPLSVTIFKPGASAPFFKITNLQGQPGSVAVDAQHNVYVNENAQDAGIVQVFAP